MRVSVFNQLITRRKHFQFSPTAAFLSWFYILEKMTFELALKKGEFLLDHESKEDRCCGHVIAGNAL